MAFKIKHPRTGMVRGRGFLESTNGRDLQRKRGKAGEEWDTRERLPPLDAKGLRQRSGAQFEED